MEFTNQAPTVPFHSALSYLSPRLQAILRSLPEPIKRVCQEIRLRKNLPLSITCPTGPYFFLPNGQVTANLQKDLRVVTPAELEETFGILCENSVYSHQNEIAQGFLSTRDGHRAGLCGTAVLENGRILSLRNLTSINLRFARDFPHCADALLCAPIWEGSRGLILAGEPSSGKTTLLRDLGSQLSQAARGKPLQVSIVDERGELSGPTGSIGLCDVLRGYHKAEGILQALRALSPQVILCDEVHTAAEISAMSEGMNSGCRMIVTVHASGVEDFLRRPACNELLRTGAFGHVAFLLGQTSVGKIQSIWKAEDLLHEMDRRNLRAHGGNFMGVSAISGPPRSGDPVEAKPAFSSAMGNCPALSGDSSA